MSEVAEEKKTLDSVAQRMADEAALPILAMVENGTLTQEEAEEIYHVDLDGLRERWEDPDSYTVVSDVEIDILRAAESGIITEQEAKEDYHVDIAAIKSELGDNAPGAYPEGDIVQSMKDVGMWIVDNGLYDTKLPWNSADNLFNIGTLGISIIAGAFTGGGGTAAILSGRIALGAVVKGAARNALTETVITAPIVATATTALATVNESLEGEPEAIVEPQAEPKPEENIPAEPETEIEEPEAEEPAIAEPAPQTDSPAEDPIRAAFTSIFNTVAGALGNFLPQETLKLTAGLAAAFWIATAGDGNDETNKLEEFTGLAKIFMEVVNDDLPDAPPPVTADATYKAPGMGLG